MHAFKLSWFTLPHFILNDGTFNLFMIANVSHLLSSIYLSIVIDSFTLHCFFWGAFLPEYKHSNPYDITYLIFAL